MIGNRAAMRYAKSLFLLAKEEKKLDATNKDFIVIGQIYEENPDLTLILDSPVITENQKLDIVEKLFQEHTSGLVKTFFKFLAEKRRMALLGGISREFCHLYDVERNISDADVITAVGLSDDQKDRITKMILEKSGKTVRMNELTDASILGGLVIKMDDEIYDGSLRNLLTRMSKTLKN